MEAKSCESSTTRGSLCSFPKICVFSEHLVVGMTIGPSRPVDASTSEQAFLVTIGATTLRLKVKSTALDRPFGAKIVMPFLTAANKKINDPSKQIQLETIEAAIVRRISPTGPTLTIFEISEQAPALDLSVPMHTLVPADSHGEELYVELVPRAPRLLKIECAGVTLSATLGAEHVHLPLHETVVRQFVMNYNEKMAEEKPTAKSNVQLSDVAEFKLKGATIDIWRPVASILPRQGRSDIEMCLTPEAYDKWGYNKPLGGASMSSDSASTKPQSSVFVVRCDVIELKLTLSAKHLEKPLQDSVLIPFLKAYSKKARRECEVADVYRVEVRRRLHGALHFATSSDRLGLVTASMRLARPRCDGRGLASPPASLPSLPVNRPDRPSLAGGGWPFMTFH